MDWFALVSGSASILGLVFSAWAVVEVRRLRQRHKQIVLLPTWTDRLEGHVSRLTVLVEDVEDSAAVEEEVARLVATLNGIASLVDGGNKRAVLSVQSLIRQRRPIRHRQQVQSVRSAVSGLVQTLQLHSEENRWT